MQLETYSDWKQIKISLFVQFMTDVSKISQNFHLFYSWQQQEKFQTYRVRFNTLRVLFITEKKRRQRITGLDSKRLSVQFVTENNNKEFKILTCTHVQSLTKVHR